VQALVRDGYRCMISGEYDVKYTHLIKLEEGVLGTTTECMHIVPESLGFGLEKVDKV
jgi:hypothetical protein